MDFMAIVASPFFIFVMALAMGGLLYLWSRAVAPSSLDSPSKAMPYVGGEAMDSQSFRPGYQFFYVALFFTIVHVGVLVLATVPPEASIVETIGYLGIIGCAVLILRWEQ